MRATFRVGVEVLVCEAHSECTGRRNGFERAQQPAELAYMVWPVGWRRAWCKGESTPSSPLTRITSGNERPSDTLGALSGAFSEVSLNRT